MKLFNLIKIRIWCGEYEFDTHAFLLEKENVKEYMMNFYGKGNAIKEPNTDDDGYTYFNGELYCEVISKEIVNEKIYDIITKYL